VKAAIRLHVALSDNLESSRDPRLPCYFRIVLADDPLIH